MRIEKSINGERITNAQFCARKLEQRITNDPARGEVLFTLIDHPVYRGQVVNRVKATAEGAVLEYALDWVPINGQEPPGGPDMAVAIQGAVLHTKALAEERARGD